MQSARATPDLFGADLHPVAGALLERLRSGSRPGRRNDPYRIALAIEGGGMRGVVTAGMVVALEALGLRDAFDVVYGSSAGSSAAAYFLARQAIGGCRLYYEAVNTREFYDPLRGLRRRPVIDLEHLFERVLKVRLPLDVPAIQESGVELVVLASAVDEPPGGTRERPTAARLTGFRHADDLLDAMHASSRVPIVGGQPVEFRGRRYWDAAVVEPVPVWTAIADGCTHVLVLLSLPAEAPSQGVSALDRLVIARRVTAISPILGDIFMRRSALYHRTRRDVLACHAARTGPPYVAGVATAGRHTEVSRTELRAERLIAGAKVGGEALLRVFGRAGATLNGNLDVVDRHQA